MTATEARALQPGDTVRWIPDGERAEVVNLTAARVWMKFEDGILGGFDYDRMQDYEKVSTQ
jgi:hypothetical protein